MDDLEDFDEWAASQPLPLVKKVAPEWQPPEWWKPEYDDLPLSRYKNEKQLKGIIYRDRKKAIAKVKQPSSSPQVLEVPQVDKEERKANARAYAKARDLVIHHHKILSSLSRAVKDCTYRLQVAEQSLATQIRIAERRGWWTEVETRKQELKQAQVNLEAAQKQLAAHIEAHS